VEETEVREKIVQASMKIFSKYGFFKAPVGFIAKEAGVSKGLVFWYFRTKDELIIEVALRSLPLDVLKYCLEKEIGGIELLYCIGEKYLKKYRRAELRNLMLHSFSSATVYPQIRDKINKLCREYIRKAAKKAYGRDCKATRVAMRTFFGSLQCYVMRPPQGITEREYLDALARMLRPENIIALCE
jgi:AcrR family transcriptional regulator